MTPARRRRPARGVTLIEVMIAGTLLIIGVLGFVVVVRYAATSTAVAHRRTSLTYFRSALVDRISVTPRLSFSNVSVGGNADVWMVDSCWDLNSTLLAQNGAPSTGNVGSYSASFGCPAGSVYRSWVRVNPVSSAAGNCLAAGGCYQVSVYVERSAGPDFSQPASAGCSPATRFSSDSCVAADLLYTD